MKSSRLTVLVETHGDVEISFISVAWFVIGVRLDRLPAWAAKLLRPRIM